MDKEFALVLQSADSMMMRFWVRLNHLKQDIDTLIDVFNEPAPEGIPSTVPEKPDNDYLNSVTDAVVEFQNHANKTTLAMLNVISLCETGQSLCSAIIARGEAMLENKPPKDISDGLLMFIEEIREERKKLKSVNDQLGSGAG